MYYVQDYYYFRRSTDLFKESREKKPQDDIEWVWFQFVIRFVVVFIYLFIIFFLLT